MPMDWSGCARQVARALARYDAKTTYAKLGRIVNIGMNDVFGRSASCYAAELTAGLQREGVGRVAAQAHVSHGVLLGFLERVASQGGVGQPGLLTKIDSISRIALSPLGRSLRAAAARRECDFGSFVISGALLESDFDMYGLMLRCARARGGTIDVGGFRREFRVMLDERERWLCRQIPVESSRRYIDGLLPWRTRGIGERSMGHHYNMRQEWGRYLGHIDSERMLTREGGVLAALIASAEAKNGMFRLGPTKECQRRIGALEGTEARIWSGWEVLRPDAAETRPEEGLIEDLGMFMRQAFEAVRLRTFAQAPLAAVIPYLYFLEGKYEQRVNVRETFETVFRRYRETFYCMLTAVPEQCHYQLRREGADG